jgi:hypothetical protein
MKTFLTSFLLIGLFILSISAFAMTEGVSFSSNGGFYDNSFNLTLTCPENLIIHYTLNGNTPTSNDAVYSQPLFLDEKLYSKSNLYTIQTCPDESWFIPNEVQRCIIIRAAAFDANGNQIGPVITNSYFIKSLGCSSSNIPVISICTDSLALFGQESGIMITGDHNNYVQRGKEWERLCNVEYYETDNSGINQQAGLRMHGASTREGIQKGMKLYARKEYGKKRFCHKFFETTENCCFKHLVLKPLKDGYSIRDHFCNRLAYSVNVETMASRPVTVFLNGEYWGIFFLKEKPDAEFISDHFGYDDEEINVIESWYGHVADGNNENFVTLMRWIFRCDLSDDKTYEQVCNLIDMDCFIDYYCFCLFIGITDWPDNNMRCWQAENGKWRWIFFDGDCACAATPNMLRLATYNGENAVGPVLLFSKLLENADFRDKFYDRYGKLLTHEFGFENTIRVFESCIEPFDDELTLKAHYARYGIHNHKERFEGYEQFIRNFLKNRILNAAGMMYNLYYINGWEYRWSAKSKQTRFNYDPKSSKPTFLLKMWRQFDDVAYLKAYLSNEPHRIREGLKDNRIYQFFKRKYHSQQS